MIRLLRQIWRLLLRRCERCGAPANVVVHVKRDDGTEIRHELMCAPCAVTVYPPEVMDWSAGV